MKTFIFKTFFCSLALVLFAFDSHAKGLKDFYEYKCREVSDIHEHLPALKDLAKECSSVTEIGIRELVSTWAFLQGLSENPSEERRYLGIDIASPPKFSLMMAQTLAEESGIAFRFLQANDMAIELKATELLFIDSMHTYAHLTYELEKFSSKVSKYIALHDTSPPWGHQDDVEYRGDYSEYPSSIDRTKRGLWPAVVDFLNRHPEWELYRRYQNCHGLTILRRKNAAAALPPPYDTVDLLPFDPQGWYSNGGQMERLFALYRPKVVIEVGCWAGASTRHMASMLPPGGVVYAVDHWKGSVEHQPGQGWWSPILPHLYEQFLSNVIHEGLTDKIVPVRMSSKEASFHLAAIEADLIYIDGSHDYSSVLEDLNVWYPLLSSNGVLCGDDWGYPDICKAVYQFAEEKGLKVINPGAALWYLTK